MEIKWIKMSTDLFNNRKIKQIERMQDGDAIIVIWLKLLVLAAEINDGGDVYFLKSVPFSEESLAVEFGRSVEIIALALRTFEAYGMIEIKDHAITIINWEKYQNIEGMEKVREQNRLRQQKKRGMDKAKIDGKMICAYCGEKGDTVDHIIPKSKGGSDDPENLVCSCTMCNLQKTNNDLLKFLNDQLILGRKVDIDSVTSNPKLNRYVAYDESLGKFVPLSRVSHALDKNRLDKNKNRLDKKGDMGETISKALLKTWQSNLDAEEANKEIRQ